MMLVLWIISMPLIAQVASDQLGFYQVQNVQQFNDNCRSILSRGNETESTIKYRSLIQSMRHLIQLDACSVLKQVPELTEPISLIGKTPWTRQFSEQQIQCVQSLIGINANVGYDQVKQYVDCMDGIEGPAELHSLLLTNIRSQISRDFQSAQRTGLSADMERVKIELDRWLELDPSYWPALHWHKRQIIDTLGIDVAWIDSSLSCGHQQRARRAHRQFRQLYTEQSKKLRWYLSVDSMPEYPMKNLAIAIEADAHKAAQEVAHAGPRDDYGRTPLTASSGENNEGIGEHNLHLLSVLYADVKQLIDRDPVGCHWYSLDAIDNFLKCYKGPTDGAASVVEPIFSALAHIITSCVDRSLEALKSAASSACHDERQQSKCLFVPSSSRSSKSSDVTLVPRELRKLLKAFNIIQSSKQKQKHLLSSLLIKNGDEQINHEIVANIVEGVRDHKLDRHNDLLSLESQSTRQVDLFSQLLVRSRKPGPYREAVMSLCAPLSQETFVDRFERYVYRNHQRDNKKYHEHHVHIPMDLRRQFNLLLRIVSRQRQLLAPAACQLLEFGRQHAALLYSMYMCIILQPSNKSDNIIVMPPNYSELAIGWFVPTQSESFVDLCPN